MVRRGPGMLLIGRHGCIMYIVLLFRSDEPRTQISGSLFTSGPNSISWPCPIHHSAKLIVIPLLVPQVPSVLSVQQSLLTLTISIVEHRRLAWRLKLQTNSINFSILLLSFSWYKCQWGRNVKCEQLTLHRPLSSILASSTMNGLSPCPALRLEVCLPRPSLGSHQMSQTIICSQNQYRTKFNEESDWIINILIFVVNRYVATFAKFMWQFWGLPVN